MSSKTDTIFAPATATGVAGVAIVRLSGSKVREIVRVMCHKDSLKPRYAYFSEFHHPQTDAVLDRGVLLFFESPHSFTGEDVAEFHIHGGRAVLQAVLEALTCFSETRMAERGEFSRRAVLNGKMDLTEAEGMLDLIHAETDCQRVQALSQMEGALKDIYADFRQTLVKELALIEAYIDFPEEEIPDEVVQRTEEKIKDLIAKMEDHLADNRRGEHLREGFKITLVGAPNVGKSSLLNRLVRKDVSIVSKTAGTTRDVIETRFDVKGYPVIFQDTAGLRDSDEEIEQEGIRRAVRKMDESDLILLLSDARAFPKTDDEVTDVLANDSWADKILHVWNKRDLVEDLPDDVFSISAKKGDNLDALWERIEKEVEDKIGLKEEPALTRLRYRTEIQSAVGSLNRFLSETELELKAEDLRQAVYSIGKITGEVEIEELFDVIFSEFCIGK